MLVGAAVLSFLLLLLFQERYNRLSVDMQQQDGAVVHDEPEDAKLLN